MFYSTVLLAATAMTGLVSAQSPWSFSTSYSTSGPIAINPDSVDIATRRQWCLAEQNSCGQICDQYSSNTCDAPTLNYTCTCSGSGPQPNISDYQQTLPYYICQQWIINCVAGHPNDLDGITECQSLTCGDKNASSAGSASSSSAASSTSSSASSSSAAASTTTDSGAAATSGSSSGSSTASSSAAATSSGAAVALSMAKTYGTGALAAGMLAAFGLAL